MIFSPGKSRFTCEELLFHPFVKFYADPAMKLKQMAEESVGGSYFVQVLASRSPAWPWRRRALCWVGMPVYWAPHGSMPSFSKAALNTAKSGLSATECPVVFWLSRRDSNSEGIM